MKKSLALITIISVLFIGSFSFFLFTEHLGHTEHCPLMQNSSTICLMNAEEHITLLQRLLLGIIPTLTLFFALCSLYYYKQEDIPVIRQQLLYFSKPKRHIEKLLQELFSQGILNPKPY